MPDIPVQNGSTRFRWRVGFSDYFAPGLSAGPRRPSFPAWPGIPTTKEASSFKELAFLCIPALVPRPLDSACGGSTSPAAAGHFRRPDTEYVQPGKNTFCVQERRDSGRFVDTECVQQTKNAFCVQPPQKSPRIVPSEDNGRHALHSFCCIDRHLAAAFLT
jgi:hypothetical protein